MENNKILIAAYGTLRKGYGNSRLVDIPSQTKWLGTGKTVKKYQMRASGIPYVNKTPDTQIVVDIWEIDKDRHLPSVDRLEGHPEWYCREEVDIELNGNIIKAWLYFMEDSGSTIVKSGNYNDYRSITNN
jgi:gamma-glutamylaminecyclotransferase